MITALLVAGLMAAGSAPSPLEIARDQQDRAALQKLAADAGAAAAKAPNDADAQLRAAVAWSYLAEVAIEQHDRKPGRQAAEQGIPFAAKASALKPESADALRILGTLYGQAITDVFSGLSNGPKAKDALARAIEKAPKSSAVWTAHGVGNYYLPAQLGGGPEQAVADFRKAIDLDPRNAEAWLWLGVALRKQSKDAEARQAFAKSLEINPKRVWVKQQLDKTPAK
jgi:tetratricopeptide (TPR) repeat protein